MNTMLSVRYDNNNVMLKSKLKPFQTKTVNWMVSKEAKDGGGFLFNEAGTGKTLCCIETTLQSGCEKTLIICPAGLVCNWEQELLKHTSCETKHIFKYTGNSRKHLQKTNNHIFFIASYSVLTKELQESDQFVLNSLFADTFTRIILDEAHYIRNWNASVFKAAIKLQSRFKWIVTATPIFNKMDDMYAYFRFLELANVDTRKDWQRLTHSAVGIQTYKYLNDIIKTNSIALRKTDVLTELGTKNDSIIEVELNDFEKEFYENLWNYSIQRMSKLSQRLKTLNGFGDLNSKLLKQLVTNNILVYILRLKQSCNNPWLVISKMNRLDNTDTLQQASKQLKSYNETTDNECPVCYDNLANGTASPCGHQCCTKCWDKIMRFGIHKCPMCRTDVLTINVSQPTRNLTNNDHSLHQELKLSSKIRHLINIIHEKRTLSEKIVIVSQWVKMLDIVKDIVSETFRDIRSVTLQGNASMKSRHQSISDFQNDHSIEICYISLMSSAEGINLTAANNLILLDSWWNQSKMIQVCDRIHRIGQTKPVNIYRLVVGGNNSIEQRIQQLISKKEKLKNLVMNKWELGNGENYDDEWIKTPIKLIG